MTEPSGAASGRSDRVPIALSPAQRRAVEADLGPMLVVAGPGAGKTLCLIERIRHLLTERAIDPGRICAVTFTNKSAEEVASRLRRDVGDQAELITRATLHSLCVKILRAHGEKIGLPRGFGIADDEYQREVLGKKCGIPHRRRGPLLGAFSLARLGKEALHPRDEATYRKYRGYLVKRRMIDFDDLIHYTVHLFKELPETVPIVAGQWDYLLVDEVQDLDPVQFSVVRALISGHGNIFAVGDDEQSIFSWRGADPRQIVGFANDVGVLATVVLDENRRTAAQIFAVARRLMSSNIPLFSEKTLVATRESRYPVLVKCFGNDRDEIDWLLDDVVDQRESSGLPWGEFALLYRKHSIGEGLEGALMRRGIPCRLAHGRSVSDHPVIKYLIAALRVIGLPGDPIVNEQFARLVLPSSITEAISKQAERANLGFMPILRRRGRELPLIDEEGRKIRRALSTMQNLTALGGQHRDLHTLVEEILSQRAGAYRTLLEEHSDDLVDPALVDQAVRLADELRRARETKRRVVITPMGGLEIGLAGMLIGAGIRWVDYRLPGQPVNPDDIVLDSSFSGALGIALTTFKALQLVTTTAPDTFRNYVVVDLETTDNDTESAEIVEIAAARVRDGKIVAEFHRLVRPRVPIAPGAQATHGFSLTDLEASPYFEEVWPEFRDFVGDDLMVAHNGYTFDFPILSRMTGERAFFTYDTLPLARSLRLGSAKLGHLAERFGIDAGSPHRALWDVRTLAQVLPCLEEEKRARARRVALSNILDYLAIALALSDPQSLDAEGALLKDLTAPYALGRYTSCLDFYRAERDRIGPSAANIEELIDRLGGVARMEKVQADRSADQRYPEAMARLRRLMEGIREGDIREQIGELLARIALSMSEGVAADANRVNLLTLHSTKGLEFSRVYIVGVEDAEMPGGKRGQAPTEDETQEARRLLYVGMTRAKDRLVMTRTLERGGIATGGQRFFDEMGLKPEPPIGIQVSKVIEPARSHPRQ